MISFKVKIAIFAGIVLALSSSLIQALEKPSPPKQPKKEAIVWYRDYHQAMKNAQLRKRPVLIKFGADWCGWCERMDVEVFVEPKIVADLKGYTCIKIDVDKQAPIARAYGLRSLPRILVVNTHQEIVGDWLGYRDADKVLRLLQDLKPALRTPMGTTPIPKGIPSTIPQTRTKALAGSTATTPLLQLGHPDPAIREQAAAAFLTQDLDILPKLVSWLEHEYLGVRIAAWKILRQLHTGADLSFDPWAPQAERAVALAKLKTQIKFEKG